MLRRNGHERARADGLGGRRRDVIEALHDVVAEEREVLLALRKSIASSRLFVWLRSFVVKTPDQSLHMTLHPYSRVHAIPQTNPTERNISLPTQTRRPF